MALLLTNQSAYSIMDTKIKRNLYKLGASALSCVEKFTRNDNTDSKKCCRIDLSSMKEGKK